MGLVALIFLVQTPKQMFRGPVIGKANLEWKDIRGISLIILIKNNLFTALSLVPFWKSFEAS